MFKTIERPNGNITIREYSSSGKLRNKLVEKGPKIYITSFDAKGKASNSFLYDNTDRVVVSKEGKQIADLNQKIYLLVQDRVAKTKHRLQMAISKKDRENYRIFTKADGKEYLRRNEPMAFDPKKNFIYKFAEKLNSFVTKAIKNEYINEVVKRRI